MAISSSLQFTAKQLNKLSQKATKEEKDEKAKLKRVMSPSSFSLFHFKK